MGGRDLNGLGRCLKKVLKEDWIHQKVEIERLIECLEINGGK